MTTVFGALIDHGSVSESGYGPALETVAPGVSAIIEQSRSYATPWFLTLEGLLPFLTMTHEQLVMLIGLIGMARGGHTAPVGKQMLAGSSQSVNINPSAYQSAQQATPASAPKLPDIVKAVSYTSAAMTVLNWLRG